MLVLNKLNFRDIPQSHQVIARAGAGVNNIPVAELTKIDIPVINTPGANATADLLIGFAGNVKRPEIMDQFDVIVQNKDLREVLNHIHKFDR